MSLPILRADSPHLLQSAIVIWVSWTRVCRNCRSGKSNSPWPADILLMECNVDVSATGVQAPCQRFIIDGGPLPRAGSVSYRSPWKRLL